MTNPNYHGRKLIRLVKEYKPVPLSLDFPQRFNRDNGQNGKRNIRDVSF